MLFFALLTVTYPLQGSHTGGASAARHGRACSSSDGESSRGAGAGGYKLVIICVILVIQSQNNICHHCYSVSVSGYNSVSFC